jgi:hypothetical protein
MSYYTETYTTFSPSDLDNIERSRENYLSGKAFRNASQGHGSVLGYKPPPSHRDVAALYSAAGRLAARGDVYVPFAMALARAGGQYQSTTELLKHAYSELAMVVTAGYTDVIRLASPEPGRRKDAMRPYSLREILTVSAEMREAMSGMHLGHLTGAGWCEQALAREVGLI